MPSAARPLMLPELLYFAFQRVDALDERREHLGHVPLCMYGPPDVSELEVCLSRQVR